MLCVTINADDFGSSNIANAAIDLCFRNNWIDRTTVMVNMPGYTEAVELSKRHEYFSKIGIHINLIEGVPLTDGIKSTIFCTDGKFNGTALRVLKNRFLLDKKTRNALYDEIDAQMKTYLLTGFPLKHIDSHEHTHTNWSVLPIILKCARKNGFRTIRLSRNIPEKEISLLYRVYKSLINRMIMSFNVKNTQGGGLIPDILGHKMMLQSP